MKVSFQKVKGGRIQVSVFSAVQQDGDDTRLSTISLAEGGLEYPRAQPDEPRAKNHCLCYAIPDRVLDQSTENLDHRKSRHLARVITVESTSEKCLGVERLLLETFIISV